MEQIKSLTGIGLDELYVAWEDAFRDYERTWTRAEFGQLLKRRGYVPELSFGAFDDHRLVAFTLNGIGPFKGLKTAYDTGTGTIKEYRGRGLAGKIFAASIPSLRAEGIQQYILEVLQDNAAAVSVYSNIGFKVSREFNYYVQNMAELRLNSKVLLSSYTLRDVDLGKREEMMQMWDFVPSWQNSFESIERALDEFKIIGVFDNDKLIAYGITEPSSGDITQIAVDKAYRRRGIASGILKQLLKYNEHNAFKVINIETTCESMNAFMENNGIPLRGSQFEMIKELA